MERLLLHITLGERMKNKLLTVLVSGLITSTCQLSFAVLDDNLGLTDKGQKPKVVRSNFKSINDKRLVAKKIKEYKQELASEAKAKVAIAKPVKKRSLGAVPSYIQDNWGALSDDQKEIVYSYHNENPYALIAKDHFSAVSRPNKDYEHDTAYGFDKNEQVSLDVLRADINGSTKDELSAEDQAVVDLLAAIEK